MLSQVFDFKPYERYLIVQQSVKISIFIYHSKLNIILYLEEESYKQQRGRDEVLMKLVKSQETYIQELESKKGSLESEIKFWRANKAQENTDIHERANQENNVEETVGQDSSILQDLVLKNQVIIQELQDKLKETEENFEDKLNQSQIDSRTKIEVLESENRILKQTQEAKFTCEKDRVNFHKTLRNNLLEEIERVEKEQVEKEKNLSQWREHIIREVQQERNDWTEKVNQLEEENQKLQLTINKQAKESKIKEKQLAARVEYLNSHKNALEQKVEETTNQINCLQSSLSSKRQQSTSDETKWETEKDELYKNLSQVTEVLEDKDKLHSQQLKSLEDGYKTSLEVLDKRIKMLNDEKRQLDHQRGFEKGDLSTSLADSNSQIEKLRATNGFLISLFDDREKQASTEIERMRKEVSNLQMFFDSREVNYIQETRKYAENVEKLHDLLENANERLEEGWDPEKSVNEALRGQIYNIENQLKNKDENLEKLKRALIKAQNQERKDISTTVSKFRDYLGKMEEQEIATEEKYKALVNEMQENDKVSNERELDDMNKINDSLGEINDLRFRIRELEANNKVKEYSELESKLIKSDSELTHAKQNLVNYIQSLNTLEDKIGYKLENSGVNLDENDEILRLRMENIRLNEENSSLLNSKQAVEANLNDRLDILVKKLFVKNEE